MEKRLISVFILMIFMLIMFITIKKDDTINVLEHMKDGMEYPVLLEYYQEDIQIVYNFDENKKIDIRYYEVDLNQDHKKDFIVIVRSFYHSSAHGDDLDILLNIGNSYIDINSVSGVPLLGYKYEPTGELFVLNSSTNGYRDIEIICEDKTHFYLVYDGESYVYVTEEEWTQKREKLQPISILSERSKFIEMGCCFYFLLSKSLYFISS